jgi:hypothetical protein
LFAYCIALSGVCRDGDYLEILYVVSEHNHKVGLAIKNPPQKPTQKTHPKKLEKTPKKTPKNPLKMGFLGLKKSFINKIGTQSRAGAYFRRKRLNSKSDYNLKSGCT